MTHKYLGNDGTVQPIDNAHPLPVSIQGGNAVPVGVTLAGALPAGENLIGEVSSRQTVSQVAFTRPGDTNAYTAKDSVCDSTGSPHTMMFPNVARLAGESGIIYKARLWTNQITCTARFRLHLYSTEPLSIADNAQYPILWPRRVDTVGYIDFAAMSTESATSTAAYTLNTDIRLGFMTGPSKHLYAHLETLDAFTPAASQEFFLEIQSLVD